MFFYTPETFGLNVPFIGEINIVFWLCVLAGVALFWNQIPVLLGWLIKTIAPKIGDGIVALAKKLFGFAKGGVDAAGKAVANATADEPKSQPGSPIKSVHELTEWAFETKDPETLSQVTSLYSVLQKQAISTAAVASLILVTIGCADPGEGRCGWHPKEPSNAAIQQIEDEQDSLKHQIPEQFK